MSALGRSPVGMRALAVASWSYSLLRYSVRFLIICMCTCAGVAAAPPCHGAAGFDVSHLPPPEHMQGIGKSVLQITTDSKEAQEYFNQGLNLLHSFWGFEAYRAFREASNLDPKAPMPYWGMYMSLPQRGANEESTLHAAALSQALATRHLGTAREQAYINAVVALDTNLAEPARAHEAYVAAMRIVVSKNPEDVDAAAFLALELFDGYTPDGQPKAGQLESEKILRKLLEKYPDHCAVHHYWVHAVEGSPDPSRALPSVEKLPLLGPKSGHLVHMPGHIYFPLGRYEDARAAFLAAKRVDEEYQKRSGVGPLDTWNYLHNAQFLAYADAETGRYQESSALAKTFAEIALGPDRQLAAERYRLVYETWLLPVLVEIRFSQWRSAGEKLQERIAAAQAISPAASVYYLALRTYVLARELAAAGTVSESKKSLEELEVQSNLLARTTVAAGEDKYYAIAKGIVRTGLLELRGVVAASEGDSPGAAAWFTQAKQQELSMGYKEPAAYIRPVTQTVAEIAARSQKWDEAIDGYEQLLKKRPNSGFAYCGLYTVYKASRNVPQTKAYRELCHAAWINADAGMIPGD